MGQSVALWSQPAWSYQGPKSCRLCRAPKEDLLHLLCIFGPLKTLRQSLLKTHFNESGVRTCRGAVIARLSMTDPIFIGKVVKFWMAVEKIIKEAGSLKNE